MFFIKIKYAKEVRIYNTQAPFSKLIARALSLFSGIIAIWRVFDWFLMMRYKNRQARMAE